MFALLLRNSWTPYVNPVIHYGAFANQFTRGSLMSIVLMVLWFLVALGILVTFHEFGHFYMARRCGVKVIRFSVGFGKPLYTWRDRLGTEYTLAAIPLGGYVKMLDERDDDVHPDEIAQAFTQKTVWQRIAIVAAGPIANFILAALLYFILALMGSSGVVSVVGDLPEDGVAAFAGLQEGDEILAVDGKAVLTWSDVYAQLLRRIGDTGNIQLDVKVHTSSNTYAERSLNLPIRHWLADDSQPDVLGVLGIKPFTPDTQAIIEQVIKGSAAEIAGLQVGDQVLAVDGVKIQSWMQWVDYVRSRPNVNIALAIDRQGEMLMVILTPEKVKVDNDYIGRAGVSAMIEWPENMILHIEYGFVEAIEQGLVKTWEQSVFILSFIKKLIFVDVSIKNLGGSFTIAQVAGESASAGFSSYLAFLAFLSVSLGVFNLMPIPVLDGGHLLYYAIEAIKGSPVSEKIQMASYQVSLVLVFSIMVVAHVNDLVRIFS
jgi:regulator of sigma E protease